MDPARRPRAQAAEASSRRDDLAARLLDELAEFLSTVGADKAAVTQVSICGGLPDLRTMTVPLMERLDVEVETLDSLFGIDVGASAGTGGRVPRSSGGTEAGVGGGGGLARPDQPDAVPSPPEPARRAGPGGGGRRRRRRVGRRPGRFNKASGGIRRSRNGSRDGRRRRPCRPHHRRPREGMRRLGRKRRLPRHRDRR